MSEVRLRHWLIAEAKRIGVDVQAVKDRLAANEYPGIVLRRAPRRRVWVEDVGVTVWPMVAVPLDGEQTLKAWVADQAERLGLKYQTAHRRWHRGTLRPVSVRRVNKRVVFVSGVAT